MDIVVRMYELLNLDKLENVITLNKREKKDREE